MTARPPVRLSVTLCIGFCDCQTSSFLNQSMGDTSMFFPDGLYFFCLKGIMTIPVQNVVLCNGTIALNTNMLATWQRYICSLNFKFYELCCEMENVQIIFIFKYFSDQTTTGRQ